MARLALLAALLPALVTALTVPPSSTTDDASTETVTDTETAAAETTSDGAVPTSISFDFSIFPDNTVPANVLEPTATKTGDFFGNDGFGNDGFANDGFATPTTFPPPPVEQVTPVPPPPSPDAPECAKCPMGALYKDQCYLDIQEAIALSTSQDTITIQGEHVITAPITFGHDLTIAGKVCGGKRAKLIGKFTAPTQGMINMNITLYNGNASSTGYIVTDPLSGWSLYSDPQPGGWDYVQVVTISGIDFEPALQNANKTMYDTDNFEFADDIHIDIMKSQPDVYRLCGVRGPDADAAPSNGTMMLYVSDCSFTNFICSKNGSAIYVPRADALEVDEKCVFHNNMVYSNRDVFGGGGGIYVGFVINGTTLQLRGNYSNNKVYFPWWNETFDGSEHGEGGAIKVDWVEGVVNVSGTFLYNEAPDGAAVQVMELQSIENKLGLFVDGYFKGNRAVNMGAGARGACVRVLNANASVHISGTYEENFASDRGAVFANNWISMRSQVNLKGVFRNNTSGQRGAIISSISQFNGNVSIDKSSEFEGNKVLNMSVDADQRTNILWVSKERAKLDEEQWYKDYYQQQNYLLVGPPGISMGAIDNWLLPDDVTTTTALAANATAPPTEAPATTVVGAEPATTPTAAAPTTAAVETPAATATESATSTTEAVVSETQAQTETATETTAAVDTTTAEAGTEATTTTAA